ncbi:MAG: RsmD family RNA methyltransferase, partial [Bacteroidales bacterium]
MRIIGGEYKGRRITPPGSLPVRPTTDMAREALFNLLRTRIDIEDSSVIDLFAGTGFISYEFCSRGAQSVTAIEQHPGCIAFIRKASEILGLSMLRVYRTDVFRFLKSPGISADIIFADPPYDLPQLASLPDLILQSSTLREGGMLILEHGRTNSFSLHPMFTEERKYGKVHFTFFAKSRLKEQG